MCKRFLVMSAAVGTFGLAVYSLAPTSAGGVQLSAGFSAIPVGTDSSIILVEDKNTKKKAGGSSGSGGSAGSSASHQQFRMQSNQQFRTRSNPQFKPQFNQQSSGNQQFRQQFNQQSSGNQQFRQQFRQQGSGGNWQSGVNRNWQSRSSGRWANRTQWGGGGHFWYRGTSIVGFYLGDVYYPRQFVVGDDCLDYQPVWSPRRQSYVWRWVWLCDDPVPYGNPVPYSGDPMPYGDSMPY